jgi:hypothetical protein
MIINEIVYIHDNMYHHRRPTYQQYINAYSYCFTCTRYRIYFSTHILAYLHTLLIVSIHLFSKFVNVLLVKIEWIQNNIYSYPHVSIMIKITNQQLFSTININNTMIVNEIVDTYMWITRYIILYPFFIDFSYINCRLKWNRTDQHTNKI